MESSVIREDSSDLWAVSAVDLSFRSWRSFAVKFLLQRQRVTSFVAMPLL
jgi:hypothetical protein